MKDNVSVSSLQDDDVAKMMQELCVQAVLINQKKKKCMVSRYG